MSSAESKQESLEESLEEREIVRICETVLHRYNPQMQLRPYQKEAIIQACIMYIKSYYQIPARGYQNSGFAFLHEMGLGKTLCMLCLLWCIGWHYTYVRKEPFSAIIVVPPSLMVEPWIQTLEQAFSQDQVQLCIDIHMSKLPKRCRDEWKGFPDEDREEKKQPRGQRRARSLSIDASAHMPAPKRRSTESTSISVQTPQTQRQRQFTNSTSRTQPTTRTTNIVERARPSVTTRIPLSSRLLQTQTSSSSSSGASPSSSSSRSVPSSFGLSLFFRGANTQAQSQSSETLQAQLPKPLIYLVSYHKLSRYVNGSSIPPDQIRPYLDPESPLRFSFMGCDEGHLAKNGVVLKQKGKFAPAPSKRARNLYQFRDAKVQFVLFMTGTAITTDVANMVSYVRLLSTVEPWANIHMWKDLISRGTLGVHDQMLPFCHIATQKSVGMRLPTRHAAQTIACGMTDIQATLMFACAHGIWLLRKTESLSAMDRAKEMLRLFLYMRQLATDVTILSSESPYADAQEFNITNLYADRLRSIREENLPTKSEQLRSLLEKIARKGEKVVVFTQFRKSAALAAKIASEVLRQVRGTVARENHVENQLQPPQNISGDAMEVDQFLDEMIHGESDAMEIETEEMLERNSIFRPYDPQYEEDGAWTLTGEYDVYARQTILRGFRQKEGPAVLCSTLKVGNVGLDLTVANHVILLEQWWSPAEHQQAVQRCHRPGQTREVYEYHLIVQQSVECHMRGIQYARIRSHIETTIPHTSHTDYSLAASGFSGHDIEHLLHNIHNFISGNGLYVNRREFQKVLEASRDTLSEQTQNTQEERSDFATKIVRRTEF